jgi:hypothetical protein
MQCDSGAQEFHAEQMDLRSQLPAERGSIRFNSDTVTAALERENRFYTHIKQQVKLYLCCTEDGKMHIRNRIVASFTELNML